MVYENVKARQRVNIAAGDMYGFDLDNAIQDFTVAAGDGQINQPVKPETNSATGTEIDISNIAWTWTVSP